VDTPIISRRQLEKPAIGPFLIDEYDSTTVVPPGVRVWTDPHDNLVIETNGASHADARSTSLTPEQRQFGTEEIVHGEPYRSRQQYSREHHAREKLGDF